MFGQQPVLTRYMNNMFRLKVIGLTQVALFNQLYEFYVDGIECLRFSLTIKPYFCDDIIDKNVPFMQEINSTLNEVHFKNQLLTIQDVLLQVIYQVEKTLAC